MELPSLMMSHPISSLPTASSAGCFPRSCLRIAGVSAVYIPTARLLPFALATPATTSWYDLYHIR